MKKLSLLFVLVMCGFMAMAQNGRIDLRSTSRAEITKSDMTALRAVFSYGSIESVEFQSEKGIFSEIALPGAYPSGEIGTPELPATHELLAVPFGANPTVSIVSFTTTDYRLSDYGINTIVPHQHSVRKDQNPEEVEFVYNQDAYQTRALATAPEASIEVQGTLRGIRVGSLVVNPLSYNAATNTLRVFNDIEVEVSFDGADFVETERMLLNTYSPYFDVVYKQMFNYRQIMDVYTDHPDLMAYPVHMLVIAPENYVSTLQPWTNWKIQKGLEQLTDEGVAQLFTGKMTGRKIIGTVGELQFEVIQYRLLHEYNASCRYEPISLYKTAWITSENEAQLNDFKMRKSLNLAEDKDGRDVFLAESPYALQIAMEKYPDIEFHFTSEF